MAASEKFFSFIDQDADDLPAASQQNPIDEPGDMFRTLIEKADDGIIVLQDGKLVYQNPAHAKLFGRVLDNSTYDPFTFVANEDRQRVYECYQKRLKGEPVMDQYDFAVIPNHGQRIYVEVKPSVIVFEGRPATLVMARDITARKRAEAALYQVNQELEQRVQARTAALQAANAQLKQEIAERKQAEFALRATETKYRTMIEQVSDAILVLQDGKVVYRNPALEKMLEHTPDDTRGAAGRSLFDFVAPEDRERMQQYYRKRLNGEPVPDHYELTIVSLRGKRVTVEVRSTGIQYEGCPASLVVMRDITVRKQAEKQLAQANFKLRNEIANHQRTEAALRQSVKEAQVAVQAKSTFLATMSHEIRTPMNGVIGMTSLLQDTPLTAEQRQFVETIRCSGDTLLTLINDILDFSKIEAGKLDLERCNVNLRQIVDNVLDLFAEPAGSKGIELAGLVHDEVPDRVAGDPTRLRQILTNLVGNAVKFTDTGAVTIQAWLAEENAEDVVIRFEIRDTGIGIRSDVQSGLFQAFTQADGSTTRKYGGTGLGLAICRQLVTLMGGTIGVESIVDKGSNFWFTIRLDKAKKASVTPLPVPAHLEGRRILCADNNALNRDIVKSYLGAWGMQVDCAADGYETLAYLQQADRAGASYSLGLIDSKLPGLNGTALVSLVKAESMQTDMHLVLLAAFDQRAEEQSALQAGFSRILVKPIRQSALYDCIAAVMGVPAICHAAPLTASEPVPGTQTVTLVKVLLAEDNIINQKVAVRMLEKLGCRVEVVANGKEAFDALGKYTYDIVFMDCQMPIMDGYAATCAIRERERQTGGHLPIIAMTANAIWGDRERCIAAGMDDYVSKPVDANVLMAVLKRWDNCWRMPIETAEGVAKDR